MKDSGSALAPSTRSRAEAIIFAAAAAVVFSAPTLPPFCPSAEVRQIFTLECSR